MKRPKLGRSLHQSRLGNSDRRIRLVEIRRDAAQIIAVLWCGGQSEFGTNGPDIMLSLLLLCLSYRKRFLERIELLFRYNLLLV